MKPRTLIYLFITLVLLPRAASAIECNELFIEAYRSVKIPRDMKRHLRAVYRIAEQLPPRAKTVKKVFYPAAGYDAATPLILFPNATEVFAVDYVAFHDGESRVVPAEIGKQGPNPFIYTSLVNARKSVVGILVGRLAAALPGFRLRRAYEFVFKHSWMTRNGVIEFDSGEGTPIRKYIHIHDGIFWERPDPAWMRFITSEGIDALIVKGLAVGEHVAPAMKEAIYQSLRVRRGILIEDGHHFTGKYGDVDVLPGTTRTELDGVFGHLSAGVVEWE